MKTDYEKQADDFCKKTNVKIKITFFKHDFHFVDDKEKRDIYKITIIRGKKFIVLNFGQSLHHSIKGSKNFKEPTNYDILSSLQKYDVGSLQNFCDEFGYDVDSKKAEKKYIAVCKEFYKVCKIWTNEEIEELQEIN